MSKVLIFGINGFVGGYLAEEFATHCYEVVGTDRAETCRYPIVSEYMPGDLSDAVGVMAIIRSVKPDVVINLAAVSSVHQSWLLPATTFQVNVVGVINILEAVRIHVPEAKVLLIGSSEEYAASNTPLSEASPLVANNPYGVSKAAQENIADMYTERFGIKVYRTRSFNHIGVGQAPNFVIPSWCKQVAEISQSGYPGVIHVGNTSVFRDFSDVRDVVRAYRLIVESDYAGHVFNVGSEKTWSLASLLEKILSFSEQPISIVIDSDLVRPIDNPIICSDCSKIRNMIGWLPELDIENSLFDIYKSFLVDRKLEGTDEKS